MEYVYFVSTVAATGLIIFLSWKISTVGNSQQTSRPPGLSAAPPLKKTISGVSEREQEEVSFQSKLETWQKSYHVKRGWYDASDDQPPLSGEKYSFSPRLANRATPQRSNRFELLPD